MRCRRWPALLLLVALGAAIAPGAAQQIHRCRSADGTPVYSDRPCRFVGAEPVAPPLAVDPAGNVRTRPGRAGAGIPDAAEGCPGPDPEALRRRLGEALERRDINALAGLYDWTGAGGRAASVVLAELQALIDTGARVSRLEAVDWHWPPAAPPDRPPLPRLRVYASESALLPRAEFRIVRHAGCVWLAG